MQFKPENLYHVYNQGNNQQPIFFSRRNYLYFIRKMRSQLIPHCDILSYCLMPNHFHWLLYVKKVGRSKNVRGTRQTALSGPTGEEQHPLIRKIAVLLSSYTQAINKQEKRSGSLFRQKTKSIKIDSRDYGRICLYYIHHNPLKANLVDRLPKWEYSSFPDYAGARNGSLVNKNKTMELLSLDKETILKNSYRNIDQNKIKNIFD